MYSFVIEFSALLHQCSHIQGAVLMANKNNKVLNMPLKTMLYFIYSIVTIKTIW